MNQRLKDKVAIITGAANGMEGKVMGIGGASARLFIQEGASVVLADIDINRGNRRSGCYFHGIRCVY